MKTKTIQLITTAILFTTFVLTISAQQKEIKIFLQKDVDLPNNMIRTDWVAIKRPGDPKARLQSALEWFFNPKLTAAEDKQKIYDVSYGMKFEGVKLKNGTATVRFSETEKANYGTSGGGIFYDAIQKTAKQFSSVKRVVICVVGETGLDGEYEKKLFKPCK